MSTSGLSLKKNKENVKYWIRNEEKHTQRNTFVRFWIGPYYVRLYSPSFRHTERRFHKVYRPMRYTSDHFHWVSKSISIDYDGIQMVKEFLPYIMLQGMLEMHHGRIVVDQQQLWILNLCYMQWLVCVYQYLMNEEFHLDFHELIVYLLWFAMMFPNEWVRREV